MSDNEFWENSSLTALAEALTVNSTLVNLWLNNTLGYQAGTPLSVHAFRDLAQALKVNSSLRILSLSKNSINDERAAPLAEALKVNSSLNLLELTSNQISSASIGPFTEALSFNSSLTKLELSMQLLATNNPYRTGTFTTLNDAPVASLTVRNAHNAAQRNSSLVSLLLSQDLTHRSTMVRRGL